MRITLDLKHKADWVKVFNPSDRTIFIACDSPPQIGTRLRVDLHIADGPKTIFRGKVIARRMHGDGKLEIGCSIALAAEEHEKLNYLNGYVRGGLLDWREVRRIAIRLKVVYNGTKGPVDGYSRDINDEGMFIVTETPFAEDRKLNISIEFPGRDKPFTVRGVVVHTVVVEDEDVPGMGICFDHDPDKVELFRKIVDDLEALFLAGKLEDKYLI